MSISRPPQKPGGRPDDRAAQERDADDRHEQQVRRPVQDRHVREDRDLEDRGEEDERAGLRPVEDHGVVRLADEDDHGLEGREVDERVALHLLVEVDVGLAHLVDGADRDPARVERGEVARAPAGGDEDVVLIHHLVLGHPVDRERALAAALGDAGRVGRDVQGRDGARLVGEQRDERDVRGDLRHLADEALGVDDDVVLGEAAVLAGADDDLVGELPAGAPDHTGRDRAVVLREAGAVEVAEDRLQLGVLADGGLVEDRLLPGLVALLAQLLVLVAGVDQAAEPARSVAERARDALGADLERAQDARARWTGRCAESRRRPPGSRR